jgi:serine/threonine-protein kinase HipA
MTGAPAVGVRIGARRVGELTASAGGRHVFRYEAGVPPQEFVALTMPVRGEAYLWPQLHPVFAATCPRGAFAAELERRLAQEGGATPLGLFALAGGRAGRVRAVDAAVPASAGAQPFTGVLQAADSRAALRSAIEAALAPALADLHLSSAVLHDGSLRWHAADGEFRAAPSDCAEWAYNASLCQRIAQRAGLEVAPLELAADRLTLRVLPLVGADADGVEDLASVQGLARAERYACSAERMVTAATAFAAPVSRIGMRRELYRRLAFSALVRDGAAHLQRFALRYGAKADVRLRPLTGTVTTSVYPWYGPARLALAVGGSREYARRRGTWRRFGAHCALADRESLAIIEWLTEALYAELPFLEEEARSDESRARLLATLKSEWSDAARELKAAW